MKCFTEDNKGDVIDKMGIRNISTENIKIKQQSDARKRNLLTQRLKRDLLDRTELFQRLTVRYYILT